MSGTCGGIREKLHGYRDGELGRWGRVRVERHLRRCPLCCDELARIVSVGAWVRASTEVAENALAPELWHALAPRLRAVDAELEARRTRGRLVRGVRGALLAGAGAAALAGLLVLRGSGTAPASVSLREGTAAAISSAESSGSPLSPAVAPAAPGVTPVVEITPSPGDSEPLSGALPWSPVAAPPAPFAAAGVVRSLYAPHKPVLLIEEPNSPTIIWVMDPQQSGGPVQAVDRGLH